MEGREWKSQIFFPDKAIRDCQDVSDLVFVPLNSNTEPSSCYAIKIIAE
jgi:hypothetical protein